MRRNGTNQRLIETDASARDVRLPRQHRRVRPWIAAAGLIVLSFITYHNSLRAPFIFDDLMNIRENAALRQAWPLWRAMWGPPGSGVAGRPVAQLSFALDYAIGGLGPLAYHVTSLILHTLAALVLFGAIRRTLLLPRFAGRFGDRSAIALAFVATALWQTHPILADSVTYLASRTEQLVGLFCLLTLYATIRGATSDRAAPRRRGAWCWYVIAVTSCALGTGSKELAATTPLLIALYDWIFLAGSWRSVARQRWGLYLSLLATVALLVPLNLYMADFHHIAMQARPHMTAWDYLKVQAPVLIHYLRLTVWPDALVIDYQGWLKFYRLSDVFFAGLILCVLLVATAWGLVRRQSAAAYCGAWCFILLAPTSSLLPIPSEVGTARRMYLPLMAIAALASVFAWRMLLVLRTRLNLSPRAAGYLGAILAAVVLGAQVQRTLARNEEFNDPVSLWAVTVARQPDNPRAWQQLAGELRRAGHDEAARQAYLRCVALDPANDKALNNLATIYLARGDDADAAACLRAAVSANPRSPSPLINLSIIAQRKGELAEAERLAREAIRLDAARPEAHLALANVLDARRAFAEAAAELRTAMRIEPNAPAPRLRLAWLLASAPQDSGLRDARQAVALASGVVEQTNRQDVSALDALALALAADARFPDAAQTAGQAVQLARAKQPERVAAIEARRDAYLAGKFPEPSMLDFGS